MATIDDAELLRLRKVERAALQLLQFLRPVGQHSIPDNNLRVALGLLGAKERLDSPAALLRYQSRELAAIAASFEE